MPDDDKSNPSQQPKAMTRLVTKLTKEMLWTVSGYAIIYRLTKDGLIEEQRKDDSPRKYYAITEKGINAMSEAKSFLGKTMDLVFDQTS